MYDKWGGILGAFHFERSNFPLSGDASIIEDCYVDISLRGNPIDCTIGPCEYLEEGNGKYITAWLEVRDCVTRTRLCAIPEDVETNITYENIITESNIGTANWGLFDINSIGGAGASSKFWYYAGDDFNDGWIYPRAYITWVKLTFEVSHKAIFDDKLKITDVTDSGINYIYVPAEFITEKANAKEGNPISVCKRQITATPKQSNFSGQYLWNFYAYALLQNGDYGAVYRLSSGRDTTNRAFYFAIDNIETCILDCLTPGCGCCGAIDTSHYKIKADTVVTTQLELFTTRIITVETKNSSSVITTEVICFKSAIFSFKERDTGLEHKVQISLHNYDKTNVLYLMNFTDSFYPIDQSRYLGVNPMTNTNAGKWSGSLLPSVSDEKILVRTAPRSYSVDVY